MHTTKMYIKLKPCVPFNTDLIKELVLKHYNNNRNRLNKHALIIGYPNRLNKQYIKNIVNKIIKNKQFRLKYNQQILHHI